MIVFMWGIIYDMYQTAMDRVRKTESTGTKLNDTNRQPFYFSMNTLAREECLY